MGTSSWSTTGPIDRAAPRYARANASRGRSCIASTTTGASQRSCGNSRGPITWETAADTSSPPRSTPGTRSGAPPIVSRTGIISLRSPPSTPRARTPTARRRYLSSTSMATARRTRTLECRPRRPMKACRTATVSSPGTRSGAKSQALPNLLRPSGPRSERRRRSDRRESRHIVIARCAENGGAWIERRWSVLRCLCVVLACL
mmetsp:Transcript_6236/g.18904  ORF Transcript_6236/g.18904 Transcript_6236/m.18904 type:complete len:203 (+) Transcript_6236:1458-2066(+)